MSLSIDNLHVSYGSHQVLKGLIVTELERGTVTGLLGPNACGKSTLVKTIAGIKKADSGTCNIIDADGRLVPRNELRDVIGYVPQDLLTSASLTAFESIVVSSRRVRGRRFARIGQDDSLLQAGIVMERLGIAHLAQRYISELSGGQRQLVAVAQMLVREPEVLLLDEPTSALDLRHQVELLQLVRSEVKKNNSLALVAIHDLNLAARYCDNVLVLKDGLTYSQGGPGQVLTPDILFEVYGFRARVIDDEGTPVVCPVNS
ncbi:ABC transporter ATP-binding protein [Arcanobacterium buesumense]|uniref:ABC transporter ATP-binding protein n=1 Tax=Arcanobacterium buesumense TaxID=2722751 RepID=A0A6H2EMV2_9ACTO|nr:ABC transporter ATP-binding protein [Arcanobacterium buesumense]QJC22408.1 ABC transporter ATP-binding protein [Arcanobacterium buesumense]